MCNSLIKQHLDYLEKAILSVLCSTVECVSGISHENEEQTERSFTYELYHQWKQILKENKSSLTINAEILKKIDKDDGRLTFPDFVLHKSQGNINPENQLIVCEVKRGSSSKQLQINDIEKLLQYLSYKYVSYPFAIGVLIIVGKNAVFPAVKDELITKINDFVTDNGSNLCHTYFPNISDALKISERIYCMIYDPFNKESKIVRKCKLLELFSKKI